MLFCKRSIVYLWQKVNKVFFICRVSKKSKNIQCSNFVLLHPMCLLKLKFIIILVDICTCLTFITNVNTSFFFFFKEKKFEFISKQNIHGYEFECAYQWPSTKQRCIYNVFSIIYFFGNVNLRKRKGQAKDVWFFIIPYVSKKVEGLLVSLLLEFCIKSLLL